MCNKCSHINNVIFRRNGTNQTDRVQHALNPENIELHDFSIEDWLLFAYHFAKQVNYFSIDNTDTPGGDWQSFFDMIALSDKEFPNRTNKEYYRLKKSIAEVLTGYEKEGNLTPHLTLFVCFLKLLEFSKKRFNALTKRHLDYFYKDILKIEKLPPKEDKVHILFELAKKVSEQQIVKNTGLDAKKDKEGNKLVYQLNKDFIANKATIVSLKNTYNDIYKGELKYSSVANSFDGIGKELSETTPFWYPFGYNSSEKNYTELPSPQLGFSIASPLFYLQEGTRNVSITITFKNKIEATGFTPEKIANCIEVTYSDKKAWQEVSLSKLALPLHVKGKKAFQKTNITTNKLQLVITIPKELPPVVAYNEERLKSNLTTDLPVFRFLCKTDTKEGHDFFRKIVKKAVKNIQINVAVFDVKSLALENDFGIINPEKPFMPFTSQPIRGGSFEINYPEAFLKKWTDIKMNATWMNTPSSFVSHYVGYKKSFLSKVSKTDYIDGVLIAEEPVKEANQPVDGMTIKEGSTKMVINESDLIINSDEDFKATLSLFQKEEWKVQDKKVVLFNKQKNGSYTLNTTLTNTKKEIEEDGVIKLTTNQSFLHTLYPILYTLAFTSDNDEAPIPNPPYTPLVETISLDYAAEEMVDIEKATEEIYNTNRIQLFHNDVFGAYEEHRYLKEQAKLAKVIAKDTNCYLVSDYCHGGELYIGIANIVPLQQVAMLIQVLEGSENPNVATFKGKQGVSWSVLCNNYWKVLEEEIIINEVDNFLKSGIVQIKIPEQATTTNTKFSEEVIWIRAKMHKSFDAVCKVFGIHTQATIATFQNNNNELSHLENGLTAETIAKLVTRIPQVKGVYQPYSSFGGRPEETDVKYYQRVSERLRHKNRAINLWDYEHIILEEFPEVYRAKCLNHTSKTSFKAPGNVLVIVIPDIINRNVFDIYEPRLSQTTLNQIEKHINSLNGMQVEALVDNAQYERVHVKVSVKFYPEFDENFYKDQLQEDITKLLSPWAFDTSENIVFGIELNSSSVIDYIEKLPYVDYLVALEMAKISAEDDIQLAEGNKEILKKLTFEKTMIPSSPKHILVSSKTHSVSTNVPTCNDIKIEESEQCLY